MKNYRNFDRLSKNFNVPQVGTSKNPTTLLYSETKNRKYFLNRKNVKTTKREHAFKGNGSAYNAEILKFFKS